jgi:hypothetical protein
MSINKPLLKLHSFPPPEKIISPDNFYPFYQSLKKIFQIQFPVSNSQVSISSQIPVRITGRIEIVTVPKHQISEFIESYCFFDHIELFELDISYFLQAPLNYLDQLKQELSQLCIHTDRENIQSPANNNTGTEPNSIPSMPMEQPLSETPSISVVLSDSETISSDLPKEIKASKKKSKKVTESVQEPEKNKEEEKKQEKSPEKPPENKSEINNKPQPMEPPESSSSSSNTIPEEKKIIEPPSTLQVPARKFVLLVEMDRITAFLQNIPPTILSTKEMITPQMIVHQIYTILTDFDYKNTQGCLVCITDPFMAFAGDYHQKFDLTWTLGLPNLEDRKEFLRRLVPSTGEQFFDYDHLARQTEGWNLGDLQDFKQYLAWSYQLEQFTNSPVILDSKFIIHALEDFIKSKDQLIDYLESGHNFELLHNLGIGNTQLVNNFTARSSNPRINKNQSPRIGGLSENIDPMAKYNEDFESQLYQDAASNHYEDLSIILDKLDKGIILDDRERKILGNYAFVIKDPPQQAMQKLHKAKGRIDRISGLDIKPQKMPAVNQPKLDDFSKKTRTKKKNSTESLNSKIENTDLPKEDKNLELNSQPVEENSEAEDK